MEEYRGFEKTEETLDKGSGSRWWCKNPVALSLYALLTGVEVLGHRAVLEEREAKNVYSVYSFGNQMFEVPYTNVLRVRKIENLSNPDSPEPSIYGFIAASATLSNLQTCELYEKVKRKTSPFVPYTFQCLARPVPLHVNHPYNNGPVLVANVFQYAILSHKVPILKEPLPNSKTYVITSSPLIYAKNPVEADGYLTLWDEGNGMFTVFDRETEKPHSLVPYEISEAVNFVLDRVVDETFTFIALQAIGRISFPWHKEYWEG